MNNLESVKDGLREALKKRFPAYPVVIQTAPDGDDTLWVRVFCVASEHADEIRQIIQDAEARLPGEYFVMLLPMIKSMETTKKYYPEFLPSEMIENCASLFGAYFSGEPRVSYVSASQISAGCPSWKAMGTDAYAHLLKRASLEQFKSAPAGLEMIAANTELALAA
jgi:hypothetical protein